MEGDKISKAPENTTPPAANQSSLYEPQFIQSAFDPYHSQFRSQFLSPPLIPSHFMPPSPISPAPPDIYEPYNSHYQGPLTFIPPSPTDFYHSPTPSTALPLPMYFMPSSPIVPSSTANCQFVFVPSFWRCRIFISSLISYLRILLVKCLYLIAFNGLKKKIFEKKYFRGYVTLTCFNYILIICIIRNFFFYCYFWLVTMCNLYIITMFF